MKSKRTRQVVHAPVDLAKVVMYYAKGIYHYVDVHPIYLLSAGIAFNVLLCAMPLMFLMMYGLGQVIEWQGLLGVIDVQMSKIVPDAQSRIVVMDTLRSQVDTIVHSGSLAGIAGLIGALWTSTALFSSLRTALNGIYGLRSGKFFALYKVYDLLLLALLGLLVVIGNFAAPLSALMHEIGQSYVPSTIETIVENSASVIVAIVSTFGLFFLLYRYLAHKRVPVWSAIVGASTATVLWECAKILFVYYLSRFHTLGVLYGTYSFLVVTALWLYYAALVFVVGGILTKLHWDAGEGMRVEG